MNLGHYLALIHRAEHELAAALRAVAETHREEPDVHEDCRRLARECEEHERLLQPFVARYRDGAGEAPERLHTPRFEHTRGGPMGLLRDLHDLYLMATECDISWTIIRQAASGARDHDLIDVVGRCDRETAIQLAWLRTRMKAAAPQVLVVS